MSTAVQGMNAAYALAAIDVHTPTTQSQASLFLQELRVGHRELQQYNLSMELFVFNLFRFALEGEGHVQVRERKDFQRLRKPASICSHFTIYMAK
jgi:hypothetical protein